MESLFKQASPKRGRIILTLAGSLLLHGGLVGVASLLPPPPQPPDGTVPVNLFPVDEGGGPTPINVSTPTENPTDTATPKPEEIIPVMPTPPLTDDLVMQPLSDPTPTPHRTMTRTATNTRTTSAQPTSRTASSGPAGTAPGGRSAGPASAAAAWVMPHPPYPTAMLVRVQGETTVRVTTDASGQISDAVIVKSTGNPVLDNHTVSYVRGHWHGPPNASRATQFVYQLK